MERGGEPYAVPPLGIQQASTNLKRSTARPVNITVRSKSDVYYISFDNMSISIFSTPFSTIYSCGHHPLAKGQPPHAFQSTIAPTHCVFRMQVHSGEAASAPRCVLLEAEATPPTRATPHAAGFDVCSVGAIVIEPRQRVNVPTGIAIAGVPGVYMRVAPRSGLALKQGIDVMAGVVDSDYRGEIGVILVNLSDEIVRLAAKTRIAQLIPTKYDTTDLAVVSKEEWIRLKETDPSPRGEGGFGSTGIGALPACNAANVANA